MGTRTVYVKNEELWETAKSIAGKDGLSTFVEEALQALVTSKQRERQREQERHDRFSLPYKPDGEGIDLAHHVEFEGKCLGDWGSFSLYLTKDGTFIVTYNSCDLEQSIYYYRTYDGLFDLQKEPVIANLTKDEQKAFWDVVRADVPPEALAIWID